MLSRECGVTELRLYTKEKPSTPETILSARNLKMADIPGLILLPEMYD
jgi:hypothetical protein